MDQDELFAGRYRLGEVLGSGGAARVYRAWDTRLARPVAVKTFRRTPDEVDILRFDNEVRTMAALSHPALVEVYDTGVAGRPYVVLQLIEGRTLRDRIAEGPLPVAEIRRLGVRLAEALAYVHSEGVIHRDVKPSNILLDADGLPYLADFGVARLTGAERITASNQMVGTAAYLAPEQVRGTEVDSRADIYALGLVLLECHTGVPEYQGTDVESAVARLHRPPVVPQDLPTDLVHLLARMTALSPHRRPSAQECASVLAAESATAETRPALDILPWTDDPPPPPPLRRHALLGAGTLLAAAGIATLMLTAPVHSVGPTTAVPPPTIITPPRAEATAPPTTTSTAAPVDHADEDEGTAAVVVTGKEKGKGKGGKGKAVDKPTGPKGKGANKGRG
ncbi:MULTISPECIES: serine/threonine-protein kinase [Actinokineospora]|uniref:non-specific serine/threonine protein kinase n=1 Tax=Actinokineospora fastidiosa TaxID=1816 RepID=A0A918LCM9_9PSEU|nr:MULTISPECIES: serine/threonine-protein kinase [Actinokineospora]UVS79671.1 Serine/threonine-protein kinase PknB [Actinokineospora sp. UTMC 2448]GGS30190.1 hypothetical protein GCM10010171_24610 [Actinokineospora fastidiosa]